MYISVSKSFPIAILNLQLLYTSTLAEPLYTNCFYPTNYTSNSQFGTNLNLLLHSLSSNATLNHGFSNATIGKSPDQVYGLALCRGDVSTEICRNCLDQASQESIQICPNKRGVLIWYEYCMLRYTADQDYVSVVFPGMVLLYSTQNNSQPNGTNVGAGALMDSLVNKAVSQPLMFAAGVDGLERGYGLVQCAGDLSVESCRRCLVMQVEYAAKCCGRKRGWRVLGPSCTIRYEAYSFFYVAAPPPTSGSTSKGDDMIPTQKRKTVPIKAIILTIVGAFIGTAIVLFLVYYHLRRRKKQEVKVEITEEALLPSSLTNTMSLQDNNQGTNSIQSQELSIIDVGDDHSSHGQPL
ncbi:hypothetical protein MRB53_021311 [Persea americana]|uniref:Uncharacterized protein n=1 Tax=Persea americana TaxID=3435 RepID=A0ACC2L4P1_PERAE|nr:hypothetical protein MRB53_021311 [Persea americana]